MVDPTFLIRHCGTLEAVEDPDWRILVELVFVEVVLEVLDLFDLS